MVAPTSPSIPGLSELDGLLSHQLRSARASGHSVCLVLLDVPVRAGDDLVSLDEVERRYILKVLSAVRGNRSTAARVLGLDRKTLYRKLLRYGQPEEP